MCLGFESYQGYATFLHDKFDESITEKWNPSMWAVSPRNHFKLFLASNTS
jgi:hypothetical protein